VTLERYRRACRAVMGVVRGVLGSWAGGGRRASFVLERASIDEAYIEATELVDARLRDPGGAWEPHEAAGEGGERGEGTAAARGQLGDLAAGSDSGAEEQEGAGPGLSLSDGDVGGLSGDSSDEEEGLPEPLGAGPGAGRDENAV